MDLLLTEHKTLKIFTENSALEATALIFDEVDFAAVKDGEVRQIKHRVYPFLIQHSEKEACLELKSDYYIGLDWLVKDRHYVHIQPKVNLQLLELFKESLEDEQTEEDETDTERVEKITASAQAQVDYLRMLLEVYSGSITAEEIGDLVQIFWDDPLITIEQKDDQLTPFLIVQFLSLLKSIVKKGLRKSYYKVQENLSNRVKGKILVGPQIKQNLLKNRFTKTYCEFQVFGEDYAENRFLKKVLRFSESYVQNNGTFFQNTKADVQEMINYCRPAFERIGDQLSERELHYIKYNPFFKEYQETIKIGKYILKQFDFNISSATGTVAKIPPFWIDMPRLFELYVYKQLLNDNHHDRERIRFQFATHGNYLDFLIKDGERSMIIDAKYKLHYQHSHIHQDIRQVAGYARLKMVREKIGLAPDDDRNIACLIIYPTLNEQESSFKLDEIIDRFSQESNQIKAYHKVYKLGIPLPLVE